MFVMIFFYMFLAKRIAARTCTFQELKALSVIRVHCLSSLVCASGDPIRWVWTLNEKNAIGDVAPTAKKSFH